ncbi:RNA polymerase sigma factor FliA [Rhodocyclaceae bacterium]
MTKGSDTTAAPKRKRLSDAECERLVLQHTPLVSAIARSLLRRLPANIEADDLIQDGMVGLLVAIIQSTTAQAGKSYDAYLSQRIRGAMLDGLRENDPGSRKVRKEMRQVEVAITQLSHRLGRMPLEGEVAEALGMPLDTYQSLLQQADGYTLFSLEDFDEVQQERDFISWCASTNANPVAALERKIVQRTLLLALSELTEREEAVMQAYYSDDRTMREIGVLLGVTEGRVSQIHTQAIAKLRAAILGDNTQPSLLKPRWRTA